MGERNLIRDIYSVETDGTDWPVGLPDNEKMILSRAVLDVLDACVPLTTYDLYRRVRDHAMVVAEAPTFKRATLLDWLYACVVRAARVADCEQRWHPPTKPKPVPTKPNKRSKGRKPLDAAEAHEKE